MLRLLGATDRVVVQLWRPCRIVIVSVFLAFICSGPLGPGPVCQGGLRQLCTSHWLVWTLRRRAAVNVLTPQAVTHVCVCVAASLSSFNFPLVRMIS